MSNGSKKILSYAVNNIIAKNIMCDRVVKDTIICNYGSFVAFDPLRWEKRFIKNNKNMFIYEVIKTFKKIAFKEDIKHNFLNSFFDLFEARDEQINLNDDFGDIAYFKIHHQNFRRARRTTTETIEKMLFYILTKKYFQYRKVKPLNAEKCLYFKNNLFNEFVNDYNIFYENFIIRIEEDNTFFNERDGTNDILDINQYLRNEGLFNVIYEAFNNYRFMSINKIIYVDEYKNFLNSDYDDNDKLKIPIVYTGENEKLKKLDENYEDTKKRSFKTYHNKINDEVEFMYCDTLNNMLNNYDLCNEQPETLRTFYIGGNKKFNDFSKLANF